MYLYSQKDQFRCGPVAVANVWRLIGKESFAGNSLTRQFINKDLTTMLDCTVDRGTYFDDLFEFLTTSVRFHSCTARRVKKLNIKKLDSLLSRGYIVVVNLMLSPRDGHYFVIDKKINKSYRCINRYLNTNPIQYLSHKKLIADLNLDTYLRQYNKIESKRSIALVIKKEKDI